MPDYLSEVIARGPVGEQLGDKERAVEIDIVVVESGL